MLFGKSAKLQIQKPHMALHILRAVIALSLIAMAGKSSAQAHDQAVEWAVRKAISKPGHCGATTEPLFYCRFDTGPEASAVLELSASKDSTSASLTYNDGDPKSTELLAVVRGFFGSAGVDSKSFDRCIRQTFTASGAAGIGDLKLVCQRTDFDNRITYEIFADRAPQAPSSVSDIAAKRR